MNDLKKLFALLKPYKLKILCVSLFNIFSTVFSVFSIALLAPFLSLIFDKIPLTVEKPDVAFSSEGMIAWLKYFISQTILSSGMIQALLLLVLTVFVCFFLDKLFNYLAIWIMAFIRADVVKTYRNQTYEKLLILPLSYYSNKKKGDIISRVINDVQDVDVSILQSLQELLRTPLTILFYLFALFFINYKLTVFVLVLLPVAGFVINKIQRKLRTVSIETKEKQGIMTVSIEESIYGIRVIKAFDAIDKIYRQFRRLNEDYNKLYIKMFRRRDMSPPVGEFLGIITVICILLYGSLLVLDVANGFSAELFITYIAMFVQIINPTKTTAESVANLRKGFAAVDRINELLKAEEIITEIPNAIRVTDFLSTASFRNVSFAYESRPVLEDVSFEIEKGKMLAICGLSGSGKSTLMDLLMRFHDVSSGEILLDGKDIRTLHITSFRKLFGVVSQESILFNDTVYNNIVLGMENVSRQDVITAAEIADAYDFISKLEHGFETNIGDRGTRLSGGQKQRITIARAVLQNPPIFILDEATSALDTESERIVQTALNKILKNKTSIIIAHRLSTIMHADKIIVLNAGKIVGQGTHEQLFVTNDVYRRLCELQLLKTTEHKM
ncbi:MAG: ABC transporter ATP-binding protein/permease [Bacteroidales bacterium]|jgi:subfamily B ATP-binding cassette protein MsbA|nr:ABC transporter ATP-binding protein/permease [Bacteroidales bacterium]